MNIIFISPIAWDNSGGAHRPVQLAKEFARRKHTVTYIEIEASRIPNTDENVRVVNFKQLGWDEANLVRAWYGFDYRIPAESKARLDELAFPITERGIVICSAPFRPALELVARLAQRGYAIVYDVLDDISEMRPLKVFCYDALAENYLAANSDLVVTLSPRLREKFSSYKNVVLIRDGVDLAPFRAQDSQGTESADGLARGERTIGFWGTMWDYNLDVPLLQTLTHARPQWQWHFIGAYDLDPARPSIANVLAAPNVHFYPSVARAALARHAKSFDVCILPTPVTPFNLARDPLKVYEYLACYKPVVSTNLEQLADMPHVYLSRSTDEFLENLERAANENMDRPALDAYLNEQTWAKRTDVLWQALSRLSCPPRTLPAPPRGAMPNAESELDRWQAYARHLERIAQDRQEHIDALADALRESSVANKLKRVLKRN